FVGLLKNAPGLAVVLVLCQRLPVFAIWLFQLDEAIPSVPSPLEDCRHVLRLRDDGHVAVTIVSRRGPLGTNSPRDLRDLIDAVGDALLIERLRSIRLVVLGEVLPVAGGIELPALLQRRIDNRL